MKRSKKRPAPKVHDEDAAKLSPKKDWRKGARVERLTDDVTKRTGDLKLDKGNMIFWAEVGEGVSYAAVESDDGKAVRRWLAAQLGKVTKDQLLTWVPVVEVTDKSDERDGWGRREYDLYGACAVSIERYFLALTIDKAQWMRLSWEECADDSPTALPDDERFRAAKDFREGPGFVRQPSRHNRHEERAFTLPFFEGKRGGESLTSYLTYTPELWRGLEIVVETINESRKTLASLLSTKKGIETVRAVGASNGTLLLGAGAK